jgi:hypothetical protein
MLKKMKLIKNRNLNFKETCSKLYTRNIQSGGGFSDDVKPITEIINFDIEIDNNNKLIEEYLEKLNSLHTTITKETPDISKEEFDKFAKELKLKEEYILAQKEKIQTQIDEQKKQNLENTQQYKTSLQELEQQNAGLNSTIQTIKDENTNLQHQLTNSSNSSQTNAIALQQLQTENKEYETKIANMKILEDQLVNLQQEKAALSEYTKNREEDIKNLDKQLEFANQSLQGQASLNNEFKKLQLEKVELEKQLKDAPEELKSGLIESLQTYDKKLLEHVKQKENQKAQIGGQRLKNSQQSYRIYANRKNYKRNLKKLMKVYNNVNNLRNKFINEHMKIYVKKNNIKMTDIKKELKFLFENRSKYLNNQTIFMGGEISSSQVYNEVVAQLIKQEPLPHAHFDNIYNQLKQIIKGEVSDDSSKDILDKVYKAVLGDTEIRAKQQKFLNKATTIKALGDEIISLLSDCEPAGMDVKFKSSYTKIVKQTLVLDKLSKLLTVNPDKTILQKAATYLPVDTPKNLILNGSVSHMISSIQSYYNSQIEQYTKKIPDMLKHLEEAIKTPWYIEGNEDMKQNLCKNISDLQTVLKKANRELDLSYIVNKYEDIAGAVRVYVRINDYAVKKNEVDTHKCTPESLCLGRSYVIEKEDEEETTYILARNPCEQDAFYKPQQKIESLANPKKESTYDIIDQDILKKYNMLGVQRYGSFFGTYENVTNKDIFEGVDGKSNNPPLKDALLQATQGYSIILFGYGYSGSGKSYTLLNGDNSMLSSFMAAVKGKAGKITIDKISELYGRYRINDSKMEANEYEITQADLSAKNREIDFDKINNVDQKIREKQIDILLKTIEDYRRTPRIAPDGTQIPATIKGTPNNPASSRSHLFIRIGVKLPGEDQGYLTLVDMAGIEDPVEIAINIFPFTDLRRKVNPFKKITPKWASINLEDFTSNKIAKKNLVDYFGKVLDNLLRIEQDVCPKAKSKDAKSEWKYIWNCVKNGTETESRRKTNNGKGFVYKYIDFRKTWNSVSSVSIDTKFAKMLEIQKQILSQAEAFTLLKDLKETFLYGRLECFLPKGKNNIRDSKCNSNQILNDVNELLDRWIINLPQDSKQQKHLISLRDVIIMSDTGMGQSKRMKGTECEEKYAILMNYCFGCMILNGIIQDCKDIDANLITYKKNAKGDVVKEYTEGFLKGVQISEKEYTELIEEGIFINETINHLAFYFKKKNNPKTKLEFQDQLKEVVSSLYSTKVYSREQQKPAPNPRQGWDDRIRMSLKTYLPSKFLYNPEDKQGYNDNVLIKKILTELDSKSGPGKPSKFIMMCLLRPEIDAKYCTGARATLEFAESVCSTCT